MTDRPWWIGPGVAAAALVCIYSAPQTSADAVRVATTKVWEFVTAIGEDLQLPEDQIQ